MPIDTREKRLSSIGVLLPWRRSLPVPDGALSQADRQQVAYLYAGIPATPVPVTVSEAVVPFIYVPWFEGQFDSGTVYYSPIGRAVDDPSTYYGGFKDDKVMSFGTVTRALSDDQGQGQAPHFSVVLSDATRELRALSQTTTVKGRTAVIRIIDHTHRRLLENPITAARGVLTSPKWTRELTVQLDADDPLSREFVGGLDAHVPRRRISRGVFTDLTADHEAINRAVPIIYGDFSAPIDDMGPIPTIPLDTEALTGMILPDGDWGRLLVCGHACTAIGRLWVGSDEKDIQGSDANALFAVPGQYRWVHSTNPLLQTNMVRQIGDAYYTIVYVWAGSSIWKNARDGKVPITVTCQGVEDSATADGSGTLITSVIQQLRHFLINYVFGNQKTVVLDPPIWAVGDPKINTDRFDDAELTAAARIAGGYPGAAYLAETRPPRDYIADFCRCGGLDNGWDRDQRFLVSMFDTTDTAFPVLAPSGAELVIHESVEIVPDDNAHWTHIVYGWGERYVVQGLTVDNAHVRDQDAVTAYGLVLPSPNMVFPFTRDAAVAQNLAEYLLWQHRDPPQMVTVATDLIGLDIELGDVFALTDKGGPTSTGWTEHACRAVQVAVDVDQLQTTITARDHAQVTLGTLTKSVSSLTRSGTTAEATVTAHGYGAIGDTAVITIAGAVETAYNGTQVVTITTADAFTFIVSGSPTSPATGTITAGTNDLGQMSTPDAPAVIKDRKTKTAGVNQGMYPHELGGSKTVPIVETSFDGHPESRVVTIDRSELGDREHVVTFWVRTTNTGTGVRLRFVHKSSGDVVAQMDSVWDTNTAWKKFEKTITKADFREGREEYELEARVTNITNDAFGYAHMEPGSAEE